MKLRAGFPTIILIALLGMPFANLFAYDKEIEVKPLKKIDFEHLIVLALDSIPAKKISEKNDQDRLAGEIKPGEGKRIQEINRDNKKIRQKSGIKQVPRSIPKLKPKTLNDRIPIRRIPMKTPKKGFAGLH
ncbi:hypothetical protein [Daejeonella sp.]|jgi:hypothetical protein|uniref:hypothetical protein n=1 Tax=Daejeonella sp. TaxID=2805397 RepID=UPI0037BFF5FA